MRSENARLSEVLFTIPAALLSEENIYRRVARAIHLDLPARDGFERTCSRDFKDAQMTRAHICTVFTLFSTVSTVAPILYSCQDRTRASSAQTIKVVAVVTLFSRKNITSALICLR